MLDTITVKNWGSGKRRFTSYSCMAQNWPRYTCTHPQLSFASQRFKTLATQSGDPNVEIFSNSRKDKNNIEKIKVSVVHHTRDHIF